MRVEKEVVFITCREFSDLYPNVRWRFSFKDSKSKKYEWHTTISNINVEINEKWLIRYTLTNRTDKCLGHISYIVKNVKLIKRIY